LTHVADVPALQVPQQLGRCSRWLDLFIYL